MVENKLILDACCGSRMFWFDKKNEDVLFADIRQEKHLLCDGRELHVSPDIIHDFRNMPYPNDSFHLVVFDPPHFINLGKTSWMYKKYGKLLPTWKQDLKMGFDECMRVLKPYGTLIFKWNQSQIQLKELTQVLGMTPLFGHTTTKNGQTIWMAFIKKP